MAYLALFPGGMVNHYDIVVNGDGIQRHVYRNALGQDEIVPIGGRPTGY